MTSQCSSPVLAGIKIIDLTSYVFGPFATMILSDLGAEVIKIEAPGYGDMMRYAGESPSGDMGPIFLSLNRNKKSVQLNLQAPDDLDDLKQMLREADVFVHNVRASGLKRLGLDFESISTINQDIIFVQCSGFGAGGSYESLQAFDDIIQGVAGFTHLHQKRFGRRPEFSPSHIADKTAGLFAVYATLAALLNRGRVSGPQFVEVPMFETFAFFNLVENLFGETFIPERGEMGYDRSIELYRTPYPTKDGYISVVPPSEEKWEEFLSLGGQANAFQRAGLRTHEERMSNIDQLLEVIFAATRTKTTAEWMHELAQSAIPAMKCNTLNDVLSDQHLQDVGFFETTTHPDIGQIRSMRHPVRFSGFPLNTKSVAPRLGEHNNFVDHKRSYEK